MDESVEPSWARRTEDGWILTIRVQPGAGRSAVVGPIGDALKVRVSAPATEGRANAELLRFLAKVLDLKVRSLTLLQGERGRTKSVGIAGDADLARLVSP